MVIFLDKIFNFLLSLKIDYHWFYGAFSQSLAALIGTVGLFIVYKLQTIHIYLKDFEIILIEYMQINIPQNLKCLLPKEVLERAEITIDNLKKAIEERKQAINVYQENFKKGKVLEAIYTTVRDTNSGKINEHERQISSLNDRIIPIRNRKNEAFRIRWNGFVVILWLSLLFCLSIAGIALSHYFAQENPVCGKISIIIISLCFFGGMYLLVSCCKLCLDIGIPTTLEYLKSKGK